MEELFKAVVWPVKNVKLYSSPPRSLSYRNKKAQIIDEQCLNRFLRATSRNRRQWDLLVSRAQASVAPCARFSLHKPSTQEPPPKERASYNLSSTERNTSLWTSAPRKLLGRRRTEEYFFHCHFTCVIQSSIETGHYDVEADCGQSKMNSVQVKL